MLALMSIPALGQLLLRFICQPHTSMELPVRRFTVTRTFEKRTQLNLGWRKHLHSSTEAKLLRSFRLEWRPASRSYRPYRQAPMLSFQMISMSRFAVSIENSYRIGGFILRQLTCKTSQR